MFFRILILVFHLVLLSLPSACKSANKSVEVSQVSNIPVSLLQVGNWVRVKKEGILADVQNIEFAEMSVDNKQGDQVLVNWQSQGRTWWIPSCLVREVNQGSGWQSVSSSDCESGNGDPNSGGGGGEGGGPVSSNLQPCETVQVFGESVQRRAGCNRGTPPSCPDCVYGNAGKLWINQGGSAAEFRGIGINAPWYRVNGDADFNGNNVAGMGYKVVRIFVSGNHIPNGSIDQMASSIESSVNTLWSRGMRSIVVFADYYFGMHSAEQLVKGDNVHPSFPEWCSMEAEGVRPWRWYDESQSYFDFVSACIDVQGPPQNYTINQGPNFTVHYLQLVKAVVSRLKTNPGVFAYALGNELRALGRGGKGQHAISQYQAIDIFARFATRTIEVIRSIDSNHLIMPGAQNITEVSDRAVQGSPGNYHTDDIWNYGFKKMLQVPFDLWNLTYYNNNKDSHYDIGMFQRYGVPVIASEWDYWTCQFPDHTHMCNLFKTGISIVMPWSAKQMADQCGGGHGGFVQSLANFAQSMLHQCQ